MIIAEKCRRCRGWIGRPVCLLLMLCGAAQAVPVAMVTIGDAEYSVPVTHAGGDLYTIDNASIVDPNGSAISISGVIKLDPFISFSVGVTDFGTPSTFGFSFASPIVPVAAPGVVTNTLSGTTTDANGDGVTITPTAPPGGIPVDTDGISEMAVYSLSTDGGTTWINAGLDLGALFVGASPSDTLGPLTEGPTAGPLGAGMYNAIRVDLNFTLSGNGDIVSISGTATINDTLRAIVPEPATLGLGLMGLVALARRRGKPVPAR